MMPIFNISLIIENGRFSLSRHMENGSPILGVDGDMVDWSRKQADEFLENYIKPQGLGTA